MSKKVFDSWEKAVKWLLDQPGQAELVRACYYDRPPIAAAVRFSESPEWSALRRVFPAKKGRALDVGAGMGIATYALARDGWETTAMEPDPSALVGAAAIEQLASDAGLKVNVVREWGEKLPFDDGSFDLVHARQVLHHATDLELFCQELGRVLVPGGTLVATREHVISSLGQLPDFLARHPLHALYGGENAFTAKQYREALSLGGFEIIEEYGPLDSVVNYAPLDEEGLCELIKGRASGFPAGRAVLNAALSAPFRRATLKVLSRLDRRPGRLHSFVCRKAVAA